jgi:hypothetical protein
VFAFLFFVIPGQPAGLNPESRDYKLEIPGSRYVRPGMTGASWFVIAG